MPNVLDPSIPIPSQEYIKFVGGYFTDVAFDFLGYFIQRVGLEPNDKVLDVGCGVGRLAYSLAYYLTPQGGYAGFDIAEKLIKWAQSEITSRFPNFNFQVVNIYNQMYNPEGNVKTLDFIFPHEDKSFELVFLISVFTHLRAKEVRHYLDEISRVLKPGSRCLCTCFLLNPESESAIAKGRGAHKMVHQLEECFTSNPQMPEAAIGYKEPLLLGWMRERGLNVVGKYYGQWCGRNRFTSYQDILVLQKN
ncbi:MAG: class I SAM-dependent methyltransferase [Okeania sp. SIO2D1]|nr:class I SAM-dependent methyltransferase [Okeania sp. SIO2D1]